MQLDLHEAVRGKGSLGANTLKGKDFLLFMLQYLCQERRAGGQEGEELLSVGQKAMSPGLN